MNNDSVEDVLNHNTFTVRLLYPGLLRQSRPIGLQENNNIVQESWLGANQQVVKKTIR